MAIPPPPYSNISGITRTIMKDNQTETIANYDGNARPGELVVNLNNNDVYIGDVNGNLLLINTGGGGTHADPAVPFSSTPVEIYLVGLLMLLYLVPDLMLRATLLQVTSRWQLLPARERVMFM